MFPTRLNFPRRLLAAAALLALFALAAPALIATGATTAHALTNCDVSQSEINRDAEETVFLALINAFRANPAQHGWPSYPPVPALSFSVGLDRPAAWGVKDMAAKQYFAHTEPAPSNRSFDQRIVQCGYTAWSALGENIAAGNLTDTAAEAFNLWINSTGHRNGMMSANFTEIGIGRHYGPCPLSAPFNGQGSCWYWSTDFGKPSGGGTEGPIFQFSASTYSAAESSGGISAVVQRIGGTGTVSVTCRMNVNTSTATSGIDYTATDIILTFASSETQKTCRVPVIDDSTYEQNESIQLSLVNGSSGAVYGSPNAATLTITNDDSQPLPGTIQFAATNYSGAENGGSIAAAVQRVGGNSGAASARCVTIAGTATADDFTAVSLTLTWADGDATDRVCAVIPVNDTQVEEAETLSLSLGNVQGASLGSPGAATITITNDDVLLTPQLTAIDPGSVVIGVPSAVVDVQGEDFTVNSVVRVNGVTRPTEFVSASVLRVTIPSDDVASVGTRSVTIFTSGAGSSNAMNLVVRYSTSDANCDGAVGADDVLNALRILAGKVPPSSACASFKPSGSGTFSVIDALRMRQIAAGLIAP